MILGLLGPQYDFLIGEGSLWMCLSAPFERGIYLKLSVIGKSRRLPDN